MPADDELFLAASSLDDEVTLPIMSHVVTINGTTYLVNPDFEDGVMTDAD